MVYNIAMVALGSALGGVCRYLLSGIITHKCPGSFPWGTFVVNIIGCLVIGFVYGLIDRGFHLSDATRLLLTVGFCGGFTTFSTFAHENYLLFGQGNGLILASYAALSVFLGIVTAHFGHLAAKLF